MSNPYFSFKQFTIYHDRCAMKVGTDGVLLGAWAAVDPCESALDVGTGTGLIAIMLAQRSGARITAIDVDEVAVEQAKENVARTPWNERIEVVLQDVTQYAPDKRFDVVVSNPPYFIDSLQCPDSRRTTARHSDGLTIESLFSQVEKLLAEKGRFSLILPAEQLPLCVEAAQRNGLYLSRYTAVITRPGLAPKRALMEFQREKVDTLTDELVVELERHVYSKAYTALTKDFYLKM